GRRDAAVGVRDLEGDDLAVPARPGDAFAVVVGRGGNARAEAAVESDVEVQIEVRDILGRVLGIGIVVSPSEVPPVHVVDEAVAVVVDPIARDLADVGPDLRGEVGMAQVDARVHDYDAHRRAAALQVPCRGQADVGDRAVVDVPLHGQVRIIGDRV